LITTSRRAGEAFGDRVADAGGRARHQRRLARKIDFHEASPSLLMEISGNLAAGSASSRERNCASAAWLVALPGVRSG
jgi:hypothetical protein